MNEQDTTGNKGTNVSRRKPTQAEPPVSKVLKDIPGAIFIFLITDGRSAAIPYASERFLPLTGLRPEEVSECAASLFARIHPRDIEPFFTSAETSAKAMLPWHLEFRLNHPDKNEIWLEWLATPVQQDGRQSWHGMLLDITERKTRQRQQNQQAYRQLLENLPDNAARVDTEGRFLYINPNLESCLSVSAEKIFGKTVSELFPTIALELAHGTTRVVATGKPTFLKHLTVPHVNGEMQIHHLKMVPEFDEDDQVTSVLCLGRDMTDFYRAQEVFANREREMRLLQRAINASSDSIFVINQELRFVSVNDAACRSLGYRLDELVGMTPLDIDPDFNQEEIDERVQKVDEIDSNLPHIFETRHRAKDGRIFPVEIASTSFFEGEHRYAIAVARDISERKRAEQALLQSEQAFRSLAESSPDEIMRVDLDHRIHYLNDKLVQHLELDNADEVIGHRPTEIWPNGRYSAVKDAATRAIKTGENVCVELSSVTADGSIGYRQILIVPERDTRGNVIGTLAFGRDITTLRENERRLQYFVDNLPGLAYTFQRSPDGQGSFPYLSPRIEEFYGVTPEEAQGDMAFLHNFTHPEDRPRIEAALERTAQNLSPCHIECRITPPGMPERWLDVRAVPERQADESILWFGIMLDITERKQANEQLQRREQEFRTLAENIPDNVARWDTQGHYLYINPTHECTLKTRAEDLIGKSISESFPGLFPKVEAGIAHIAATGNPIMIRHQSVLTEQNEIRFHDIKMVPEYDDSSRVVGVLGLGRDMTDIYHLQEAVSASEQAFRSLAENIPDLVVRYNKKCQRTFISPHAGCLTNPELNETLSKAPQEHWILPSDPKGAAAFQAHLQQVLDSGQMEEWEINLPRPNGEVVTLEFRATPEFGPDGKTTGVLTMARDITTRRAMEQQLRMAASVFDTAKEGIIITDPRGCIFDTNPAFSAITGYAREDVLGQRPSLLAPNLCKRSFYRSIWSSLRREGTWSGEIVNRRKNGERYYLQLNVTAIHDENKNTSYYITIFSDITQLKRHEQQLQHIAYHDALTGLPNRLLLGDRLSQAITQARRNGKMLAVLYLDLDSFKPINDNFGHEIGDLALIEVAHRLSDSLRDSDTVARLGGDEFVVLLADLSDFSECGQTAHRLLDCIIEPIILGEHRLYLSASIGISRYPDDGSTDTDILLRYADQAMYLAKTAGRNQFLFYGDDPRSQALNNSHIIHNLRSALDQDQIAVYYQPIINMATGQLAKAEALARWEHPEQGLIPPSEFIRAAENSGLIHSLSDLVFEQSIRVAHTWNKLLPPPADEPWRISINLSPRQFFHRDGVSSWVQRLMEQEISGEMVTAEITESLLLEDRPEVIQQLNQLRDIGMTISLDDFGTGYSALSYLKKFDIDYLKIDRSFIRHITKDPNDRAIVEAIIVMAKRLGIKLVAEGVETSSQAALLAAVDCDMAQGYWYAKPMPEAEFLAFASQFQGQLS
jgi:diguanylate cyclase (GGDEF)-like protein/PAS domain S-box-containing protein